MSVLNSLILNINLPNFVEGFQINLNEPPSLFFASHRLEKNKTGKEEPIWYLRYLPPRLAEKNNEDRALLFLRRFRAPFMVFSLPLCRIIPVQFFVKCHIISTTGQRNNNWLVYLSMVTKIIVAGVSLRMLLIIRHIIKTKFVRSFDSSMF